MKVFVRFFAYQGVLKTKHNQKNMRRSFKMTTVNTVKVGIMPGRLEEYAVPSTSTVAELLATAGISADGYEVKQDGNVITNLNETVEGASVILLSKKIKGNATEIKMGVMPGRLDSYVFEDGTTYKQAFETANINPEGFEVKADGNVITNFDAVVGNPSVILLTRKVKGNSSIKIGVMPGRLEEYALEDGTTIAKALEIAGLSVDGYEVKQDGNSVTDFSQPANGAVILLTKKVKGN